jgi:hypothetical protein
MEDRDPPVTASPATYEIRLQGTPPEPLKRRFPSATMFTTPTETVLFRSVEDASELDVLVDQLLSMGLVLTEIHEVPLSGASLPMQPRDPGSEAGRDGEDR